MKRRKKYDLFFRFSVVAASFAFRLKSILHDYVLKLKLYRTYNDSYKTATHTHKKPTQSTDSGSVCGNREITSHKTMDETHTNTHTFAQIDNSKM